tara:strand:+ start:92 stop:568 length:477 start_codon:yes stop_codon:yes gene_type:complete
MCSLRGFVVKLANSHNIQLLVRVVVAIDYKMKRRHKKMPNLEFLLSIWDYDPTTGGLYKKGAEPCELNCLGHFAASGHKAIHVPEHGCFLVHRLVFFMFHRKDPGQYVIDHINGDPADNRIINLRRCRQTTNAKNPRSRGKYVVDDDGVGKWVSGVVK